MAGCCCQAMDLRCLSGPYREQAHSYNDRIPIGEMRPPVGVSLLAIAVLQAKKSAA
ncbi:hypothetical protein EMIT0P265_60223 [Pseudomonas zeae]